MVVRIITGDCLTVLPQLAAEGVLAHAVVCDPPYHLTTGKKGGSGPKSVNLDGPYGRARIGTGFMGKAWDGGDVAFHPETWAAVMKCIRPGAHLVAFGGTRTWHRMAVAIEDAGFEIRDTLAWLYGSGFPKSRDVSKGIDKAAGAVREVEAAAWAGWGTALKPAFEPIILARKPLIGTVAANVLAHGTGALNIDACRVATTDALGGGRISTTSDGWDRPWKHDADAIAACRARGDDAVAKAETLGRWPANVLTDGSDEAEAAFAAFGKRISGKPGIRRGGNNGACYGAESRSPGTLMTGFGDTGSASRFFYCAKANASDRVGSKHPTVKPGALMRWLVQLVTPSGGLVLDPFAGTGSTGLAADQLGMDAILIEQDATYAEDARRKVASNGGMFADAVA